MPPLRDEFDLSSKWEEIVSHANIWGLKSEGIWKLDQQAPVPHGGYKLELIKKQQED